MRDKLDSLVAVERSSGTPHIAGHGKAGVIRRQAHPARSAAEEYEPSMATASLRLLAENRLVAAEDSV